MKLIETQNFLKKLELQEFPQPPILQLKHPILLCHGFGALVSMIKPSPMHEVCMLLREHGIIAFAPNIVPYAKIETRSLQWVSKIEKLADQYKFEKLNIIAHSMSGLDIRYALTHKNIHPRVASLTTVATPHRGSSLAELILNTPKAIQNKLADAFNWFGNSIYPKTESDSVGAVRQLTRNYILQEFNPDNPDRDDISYFSYSASVGKGTDQPLNPLYRFQNQHIFDNEGRNDSFVAEKSARWGKHMDSIPLSHLEQIKMGISKDRTHLFERSWFEVAKNLAANGF